MRNLKLEIEYAGTNYCGWQRQNSKQHKKSIQEIIEKTLQRILQEKVRLIASGRTDAGVHALAQVANFKTNSKIPPDKLQVALNGLLPEDITIHRIEEKDLNFHSRFAVKSKIYRYTILNRSYPSAILRNFIYFYPYPLDIRLMRQEARCLLGKHNFAAFCASVSNAKNTIRTIKKISIKRIPFKLNNPIIQEPHNVFLIIIDIEADGFLYNMVRNIVGTLIEVGRGQFPVGRLKEILLLQKRVLAGPTAPAKALTLVEIKY